MWILLFLACTSDDTAAPDPVDLAAVAAEAVAAGPHTIGYRTTSVSWTDPLLTSTDGRSLRVSIWYPASEETGEPGVYQGLFRDEAVHADAELLAGTHPVAVFSHGHQAYGEASAFLSRHLASHGWVVVAPDHTGNLTWDGDERDTAMYLQRPLDLSAVLDWLDAPAGDPLDGALGAERLAIGHSFGGYTVEASLGGVYADAAIDGCPDGSPFCSTMDPALAARLREGFADPRWSAAVSMAPGDVRLLTGGLADLPVPVLLMTGGLDGSPGADTHETWVELGHPEDRHLFLPDAGHNAFTDFAGSALDAPDGMDPELGWSIIRGWVLVWARSQVLGEQGLEPILDGDHPLGEAVGQQVANGADRLSAR